MNSAESSEADHSLDSWLKASQSLAAQSVARFLAIEKSDPCWSGEHDQARASLIDQLLQTGHRREARALVHRWLLGYCDQLAITPTRTAARRQHLWRCLADVVEHTADQQLLETFWNRLTTLHPEGEAGADGPLPLLGVPILNRFDLLKRLIESLDHPVDTLALVDNSGGVSELSQQLRELQNEGHPLINRIVVATPFHNLGVAGSWNHILTSFPDAPIALLANNDVRFTANALRTALSEIYKHKACFLPLLPGQSSFSAFMISHQAWNTIGLFDENFYPAYCEDIDYLERLQFHPEVTRIDLHELQKTMAASNLEHSATINSNAEFALFNHFTFQLNRLWMLSKRRYTGDARGTWLRRWLSQWSH